MKHRLLHSFNLRDRLGHYAALLQVDEARLAQTYEWMLAHDVAFEDPAPTGQGMKCYVSYLDVESRIEPPLARRFYALLKKEVGAGFVPIVGLNLSTLIDRCRRLWEQVYNILINKIPSHHLRIAWLRIGGAKIGKGTAVWRHTEVLGIEGLRIGDDTCIGWHCVLDARAGLTIGSHVTMASHNLIIAGGHDVNAPEFWAVGEAVRIDDYVWLTVRTTTLGGAHIGEGAVIAAHTVVRGKVEPYTIVAGEKARVVGTRARGLNYKVGGKGLFNLLH